MDEEEKAVLIMRNFEGTTMDRHACDLLVDQIHKALRAAKLEGWNSTIEEAARIAENVCTDMIHGKPLACSARTAKAIRKLKKDCL